MLGINSLCHPEDIDFYNLKKLDAVVLNGGLYDDPIYLDDNMINTFKDCGINIAMNNNNDYTLSDEMKINKQLNVIVNRNKAELQKGIDARYTDLGTSFSNERKEIYAQDTVKVSNNTNFRRQTRSYVCCKILPVASFVFAKCMHAFNYLLKGIFNTVVIV